MSVLCILSMATQSFTLPGASGGLIRSRVLCSITRKMSSRRQMGHLERTASNYRQDRVYLARVCGIMDESETVKRLQLAVHPDFTFRAGQWVDFFIPGMEKVGGFSVFQSRSAPERGRYRAGCQIHTTYPRTLDTHQVHHGLPCSDACGR